MGVSPGEGYVTSVIDSGYEALGEEADRLGKGGGDDVREGFDYALGLGVRGGRGANGEEMTGGIRERVDCCKGVVLFSLDFWC